MKNNTQRPAFQLTQPRSYTVKAMTKSHENYNFMSSVDFNYPLATVLASRGLIEPVTLIIRNSSNDFENWSSLKLPSDDSKIVSSATHTHFPAHDMSINYCSNKNELYMKNTRRVA